MEKPADQSRDLGEDAPAFDHPESWWKHGVIYQIYPRSFNDESGDGVGDLAGIRSRLDYIQSLGVSAIWISPFFKSPMKDFGYDVEDHRAIDPLFGTLDEFDALVSAAHDRGIRVMIDLVLSHTADTHPWFQSARSDRNARYSDCFVWADPSEDGGPPNNWLSIFGGSAWTFEPQRQQYYLHNFLESQPDLNFHHPAVQEEALSIARWWLDRGVDGFRLDTVNFYFHDRKLRDNPVAEQQDTQVVSADNPYSLQDHLYDKNRPQVCDFLSRLGSLIGEYPGAIALGEVGATEERALDLMAEYQQPGRLQLCYTFDLLSTPFSADAFRRILTRDTADVWRCVAFSNHDVRRTASRLNQHAAPTEAIASMAMALLLCLRGTPCIYQGEELGLTEAEIEFDRIVDPYGKAFWPEFKGRDGCRTPMPWRAMEPNAAFTKPDVEPWLPIPEAHKARAVDRQEADALSMLLQTRQLIDLHRQNNAFRSSEMNIVSGPEPMLVFERCGEDSTVLCAFNISNEAADFSPPEHWKYASLLHHGGPVPESKTPGTWTFPGWSWVILESLSSTA